VTGSVTGSSRQNDLVNNDFGFLGVFFQVIAQGFADGLVNRTNHLIVAQLGFGLSLKLRFGYLDGNDSGKAFPEVVAGDFHLDLFQHPGIFGVFLERTGQSPAETGQVCTPFYGVDVVDVGKDVLVVGLVVHHGHFNGCTELLGRDVDDVFNEGFSGGVQEADKLAQTFRGMEYFLLEAAIIVDNPSVCQRQLDAGIQVGQFPQAPGQHIVFVFEHGEDLGVRFERNRGTSNVRGTDDTHVVNGFAALVILGIELTVTPDFGTKINGKGVDAGNTHTV